MKKYEELLEYMNKQIEHINSEIKGKRNLISQNEQKLKELYIKRDEINKKIADYDKSIDDIYNPEKGTKELFKKYRNSIISMTLSLVVLIGSVYVSLNPAVTMKLSSKVIYLVICTIYSFILGMQAQNIGKYKHDYQAAKKGLENDLINGEAERLLSLKDIELEHLKEYDEKISEIQLDVIADKNDLADYEKLLSVFLEKQKLIVSMSLDEETRDLDAEAFAVLYEEIAQSIEQKEQKLELRKRES